VSVDAVIVVAALIGLVGFLRSLERLEARHFRAFICLAVVLVGFVVVLYWSGNHLGGLVGPKLRDLEMSSSP
jgi:type III secretory pathway component EscS